MMTHHTILLTAGVLLASLGTSLSAVAQPTRIAPKPSVKETTPARDASRDMKPASKPNEAARPADDAKPTAPSRVRVIGQPSAQKPSTAGPDRSRSNAGPTLGSVPGSGHAKKSGGNFGTGDPSAVPPLQITVDQNKIVMRDAETDRVLIDNGSMSLWEKYGNAQFKNSSNWVVPSTKITPRDDGFDVEFTFNNTTGAPARIGHMRVPGIAMPRTIQTRKTYLDASEYSLKRKDGNGYWVDRAYNYPSQAYAPVMIFSDGEYTIGVSLMYPMLEYKHSVHTRFASPNAPSGTEPTWMANFEATMGYGLAPLQPDERSFIQPGETRKYTMAVRVIRNREGDHPNRWLQTLVPYRDYFRSLYGGVQYQRDPRPIMLLSMATREQNNDQAKNPRSYNYNTVRAPDKFGFGPWAQHISQQMDKGIYRYNMVGISGAQWSAGSLNNPFLVASPIFNEPAMALARESIGQLHALADDGANLCFWWGRSATVAFGWDTGVNEPLDPANPKHIEASRQEIEAALRMGVGTLGLDDFKKLRSWDAYGYLQDIRSEYPDIALVIEPMPADILHTLAPGFIFMNRPIGQENFAAEEPHVLADFLLPGHEIWGNIRSTPFYQHGQAVKGLGVPDHVLRVVAERAAADGYSPVIFGEPNIQGWDLNAKESWTKTVPADLRN